MYGIPSIMMIPTLIVNDMHTCLLHYHFFLPLSMFYLALKPLFYIFTFKVGFTLSKDPTSTSVDMVIDTNMNTTNPAMDHHTNLAQEKKHLQEKTQILYEQVELLTRIQHLRQEQLLHRHEAQNADSEDSAMKEDQDQDQPASAPESEIKKPDAEKQLGDELKQDDSDVTLGREDGGEQEQETDGEPGMITSLEIMSTC